jgi:hypothetical protein
VKPDADRLLEIVVEHLLLRIGPALPTAYARSGNLALVALMMALREEFERAAARRFDENRALRNLFAGAAPVVADAELRARLEQAAAGADESLAVSRLEAVNAALRGLLIELHAHVERLESDAARRVDAEIWRELAASTERRRLSIAVF